MLAVMSAIPFAGLSGGPIRGTRLNALDALSARAVRIAALPGLQRAQCAPEQTPGRRPPTLSLGELAALVDAMPERYQPMTLLAAWCGLRFGELTELRRKDIDLANGVIHVRRAVTREGSADLRLSLGMVFVINR
jgi:integrase